MPPGGGAPPPGAPPPGGGAAPIGSSSATGPTQNLGATAQANQILGLLLQNMAMALTKLPPGTPAQIEVSKAFHAISSKLEPGSASPAGINNAQRTMALQAQRMGPQQGALHTQTGAPAGAAPPAAHAA